MSDQTANMAGHHARRVPKTEARAYFALILLIAVPVQAVAWIGSALRHGKMPATGPLGAAWRDAQSITPMIFRG